MKPKIVAIGNNGSYQFIIFLKSKGLLALLAQILTESGEMPEVVNTMLTGKGLCETEELMGKGTPLKEADAEKIVDERFNFTGDGFSIDIIFGKERVFLIGHLTPKKRVVLTKNLQKCDYVKPKVSKK